MNTFRDVIDAFGGYAEFSVATGIPPGTVSSMRTRSAMPSRYWKRVVEAALENQIDGVSFDRLASIADEASHRTDAA